MIEENYINPDEALLQDKNRPRDEYWFKIRHWMNTDRIDFWISVKNFYLDQITAIWGKEITWVSGSLIDDVIPLRNWTSWYSQLPLSNYWLSQKLVEEMKGSTYIKWNLKWKINEEGWIIVPSSWTYLIDFYAEVYFDPNQWQTSFMVSLLNDDKIPYARESKVNATNPDVAWKITLQDLEEWSILYLWWKHASASWKKALYLWTLTIVKLS